MPDFKVGRISHYYEKIGVAVLDLTDEVSKGETIRISGHSNEFTQKVNSMQVEHAEIQTAKKGQSIGLKVDQPVKEGDEVYKLG